MHAYQDLVRRVLKTGILLPNRTLTAAYVKPADCIQFDLREGFPAVTCKKLQWKSVVAELLGFLAGTDNAATFRKYGTRIWDANANLNQQWLDNPARLGTDDLGPIYGVQARKWKHFGQTIDQLQQAIDTITLDPFSRRIIVTHWNPGEIQDMSLPPCHILYQFLPDPISKELHLVWYQRSVDVFLGLPFNIASYALLLHIVCDLTGYKPATVTGMLGNVHIYENHVDACHTILKNGPLPPPTVEIPHFGSLSELVALAKTEDYKLVNYQSFGDVRAPMAV